MDRWRKHVAEANTIANRPKPRKRGDGGEKIKREFLTQVELAEIPKPVCEHRFHETRQWRFDWAWPELRVAVEYEGGIHHEGRHTRGKGFESDCEKYNEAAIAGWIVIRITYDMVRSGLALHQLLASLAAARRARR